MPRRSLAALTATLALTSLATASSACTSYLVTPGASLDGSSMITDGASEPE